MTTLRLLVLLLVLVPPQLAQAGPPAIDTPLPPLAIDDRGELLFKGDDFDFSPWTTDALKGGVHVVQYFGATMGDSEKFKPFTDRIQQTFPARSVAVTTIINMDAALWGTGGFVLSEVKKNKKVHPGATIVIDEDGEGVKSWELGKVGSALMIIDAGGIVRYIQRDELSEAELATSLELLRRTLDG